MTRKQMICMALAAAFLFLSDGQVLADSDVDKAERLLEKSPGIYPEGEDSYPTNNYSVPRKQVLLEIATGVW